MPSVVAITDSTLTGLGFEALVAMRPDVDLVGTARSQIEALGILGDASRPVDVLVVDWMLASDPAADICRTVRERHGALPVLALSDSLDDAVVREALAVGVRAFLYRDASATVLAETIGHLAQGNGFLDPRVTVRILEWATPAAPVEARDGDLSEREFEVLRHVAEGASNKQIARRLDVTENTVKMYLRRAFRKLGCETRAEATAIMSRRGLLPDVVMFRDRPIGER